MGKRSWHDRFPAVQIDGKGEVDDAHWKLSYTADVELRVEGALKGKEGAGSQVRGSIELAVLLVVFALGQGLGLAQTP